MSDKMALFICRLLHHKYNLRFVTQQQENCGMKLFVQWAAWPSSEEESHTPQSELPLQI